MRCWCDYTLRYLPGKSETVDVRGERHYTDCPVAQEFLGRKARDSKGNLVVAHMGVPVDTPKCQASTPAGDVPMSKLVVAFGGEPGSWVGTHTTKVPYVEGATLDELKSLQGDVWLEECDDTEAVAADLQDLTFAWVVTEEHYDLVESALTLKHVMVMDSDLDVLDEIRTNLFNKLAIKKVEA